MEINYRQPDYTAILVERNAMLAKIRKDKTLLAAMKVHYRHNPWDFVRDWCFTFDPRNIEKGLLANMPFVPWARQVEYLKWLHGRWKKSERGLVEKSRDCGVTWLCVCYGVSQWLFETGFSMGIGSRKENLVDNKGDPDSIFEKIRHVVDNLPAEFMPKGFNRREHSLYMRLLNPENGSSITGEAGDNIGRGGRKSMYIVDEAAFVERQSSVDAALSQTTNCQIDVSTFNGSGNEFYRKQQRFQGTDRHFVFDWRDDPRKDDAWYQKQKEELSEEAVAQEIDRDPNASNTSAFIPAKWVAAAIDAHVKLGFRPSGLRVTAFDPADVGDAKACVNRYGSVVMDAQQKKDGDITDALPWAFEMADNFRADIMGYDGDGMGAPVMKVELTKMTVKRRPILAYHGSAAVSDPDEKYGKEKLQDGESDHDLKTNADTFLNYRAQTWTWLRDRFEATYKAIQRAENGMIVNADPDDMISISSECKDLQQLQAELSRPKRQFTNNGKIKVESKADMKKREVESPNLADALVVANSFKLPKQAARNPIKVRGHRMRDSSMGY